MVPPPMRTVLFPYGNEVNLLSARLLQYSTIQKLLEEGIALLAHLGLIFLGNR